VGNLSPRHRSETCYPSATSVLALLEVARIPWALERYSVSNFRSSRFLINTINRIRKGIDMGGNFRILAVFAGGAEIQKSKIDV
jgi:hypothetical protein